MDFEFLFKVDFIGSFVLNIGSLHVHYQTPLQSNPFLFISFSLGNLYDIAFLQLVHFLNNVL